MTYIVVVWNNHKERKVLKGFDRKKPVYVSESQWKRGTPVQEFGNTTEANRNIAKIDSYEHWRSRAIVEVH